MAVAAMSAASANIFVRLDMVILLSFLHQGDCLRCLSTDSGSPHPIDIREMAPAGKIKTAANRQSAFVKAKQSNRSGASWQICGGVPSRRRHRTSTNYR
jgi:hypothetical protein